MRRFRCDDSQRDLARESLIVNLDKLRHCVPNTNDNSANSMNAYVHDFSLCLTDMMSPFFENYSAGLDTRLNSDSKPVHSSVTTVADKPWFTVELKRKFRNYSALCVFNSDKSNENHVCLLEKKGIIKHLNQN